MRSSVTTDQPRRPIWHLLLVALIPLLSGGWLSGPQSTFDTKGPVAETQLEVFYVTLWVTLAIFVVVGAVLAYATIKFKARSTDDEHAEPPPQGHGNPLIELSLIVASVLALVIIAVPTLKAIWYTYDVPEDQRENAYEVTAIGYQWWFKFEYTNEMATLPGGAETRLVTANELVIPAGRPVRVNLRTTDVIHSFWVPKLAGKVDMIPNRGNHLWLQADEPGYFWGQCAEYCGESHAVMRFRVIALAEDEFNAWLNNQKALARTAPAPESSEFSTEFADYGTFKRNEAGWSPEFDADPLGNWRALQQIPAEEDTALIAHGRQVFAQNLCITCHAVRGHEGGGVTGPDLTHMGARSTIAAGLLENTPRNLYRWIIEPDNVKPGNQMYEGIKNPAASATKAGNPTTMQGYVVRDFATQEILEHRIEVTPEEGHALVAYLRSLK